MIGLSGSFAFNGTNLSLQPTTNKWVDRAILGYDGQGHPIYSAIREHELTWQLINASDLAQIIGFYNVVQNTGTCSVDLPAWGNSQYLFTTYSGCTLQEPTVSENFVEHTTDVKLLILNIRTQ